MSLFLQFIVPFFERRSHKVERSFQFAEFTLRYGRDPVRKVACGAAENTPVIHVTNLSRALREMQDAGIWVIGTADEAENTIYEEDLTSPIALVMGSEGQGLRQNTRKHCDKLVNIPMAGVVESLNVSVAAGVCLYEARRQRHID